MPMASASNSSSSSREAEKEKVTSTVLSLHSCGSGVDKSASALSLVGPAAGVVSLDSLCQLPQGLTPGTSGGLTATQEMAVLITTQLSHEHTSSTPLELRRDGGGVSAPPPILSTAGSALLPLKPLPLQPMTTPHSQAANKMEPLVSIIDNKRVASLQAVARRSSTNGSSYPAELFHTARRLSETERGLKQALTGLALASSLLHHPFPHHRLLFTPPSHHPLLFYPSLISHHPPYHLSTQHSISHHHLAWFQTPHCSSVMNHATGLLEASANSLVSVANSSEVT